MSDSAPQSTKEIALAFTRGPHHEVLIDGVLKYAAEHQRDWSFLSAPESLSFSILDLAGWHGDGILAALTTEQEVRQAELSPIPVVNISSVLPSATIPSVVVDNVEIGRLAGDHLVRKRFRSLAFYGLSNVKFSEMREQGFREVVEAAGVPFHSFRMESTYGSQPKVWAQQQVELREWLESLPIPCGIFAVTDYRARQVIDACRHLKRRIPEEFGVIGVDNEEVVCEHCKPTLSSVARNDVLQGMRAAAVLDGLMASGSPSEMEIAIPAIGVVERETTSGVKVSDPRLQEALDYIQQHLNEPITIDHLTRHISVSRRWLEYAFRENFGESPYQYLRRQRLSKARLMLHEPKWSIREIATVSGFSSPKQFKTAFQAEFGVSPHEYRQTTS